MTDIKSQDDLNKPETHSTEVLLSTLEELERTKKQLKIAVEALKTAYTFPSTMSLKEWCEQEIKKIKELEK